MEKRDHIKEYWEAQGNVHGASPVASWGDLNMIGLEIENIKEHLPVNAAVLDVGCANGYTTLRIAEAGVARIDGVEYAESLYGAAVAARENSPLREKVRFMRGDIRKLELPDEAYDFVYTVRVLINLPSWQDQVRGIEECLRVCKRGGRVLFSEAFWEPLCRMNALRLLAGLSPLVEHDFNRYLKVGVLETYFQRQQLKFRIADFSSLYYLGTRFLRDLIEEKDRAQGYDNSFNQHFADLERMFSIRDFGIQKAYILEKI